MSLATRCVACGTVFRVVQDQLRVSSGWVRCGRCGEVFNAIESLVDLDGDRADGPPPTSVHRSRVMDDLSRVSGQRALAIRDASRAATTADAGEAGRPAASESMVVSDGRTDALAPSLQVEGPPSGGTDVGQASAPAPADLAGASVEGATYESRSAMRAPGFVRQADREARWRRPRVRALLSALVLAAFASLVWQVHLTHHDWLAARWPILRPWMTQLCAWSGCRIHAPRHIDALAVESSGLVRDPGSEAYRLSVSLRNRAAWPVMLPALDLVVTDAAGQVVARRVLRAEDLGEPATSVAPGAELPLSGALRLRSAQVTGYTIELFYP